MHDTSHLEESKKKMSDSHKGNNIKAFLIKEALQRTRLKYIEAERELNDL